MTDDKAKSIIQYLGKLESDRSNWHTVWQEINDYMLPNKQSITYGGLSGQQRYDNIFDSIATKSIQRLAASLGALLTNPASNWLGVETDDEMINSMDEAQEYFDIIVRKMMRCLDNSNFYTEVNRMYIDLVAYGTGVLYVEPSKSIDRELRFSARGVREVFLSENNEGIVDVAIRKFEMTARQIIEEFGIDKVSDRLKDIYEKTPEESVVIVHSVRPRQNRSRNKRNKQNKRYESVWLEHNTNHILREGGYDVFPYVVARWNKETGEIYGRSPAMDALPEVKTIHEVMKVLIKTGQRIADPIMMVPDDSFSDITGEPGQIVAYDPTTNARIEPVAFGANLPFTFEIRNDIRESIKDCFYSNQMTIPTGNRERVTAEEIRAKQAESARILGPTFGTLNYEFLVPLVHRIYDILLGVMTVNGEPLLPPPPSFLVDRNLKLKFLSPLAKSQRSHELQSIEYSIALITQLAQLVPDVIDNLDTDRIFRVGADISGSPAVILKPIEQVLEIREQRAQQMEQERQMALAQQAAGTIKDVSQIPQE
jgi:hypothetical protein